MTEADAEAVVVALGSELTWEVFSNPWIGTENWNGFSSGKCYQVVPNRDRNHFDALLVIPENEECPLLFGSVAEAKTACERHYATGRWE